MAWLRPSDLRRGALTHVRGVRALAVARHARWPDRGAGQEMARSGVLDMRRRQPRQPRMGWMGGEARPFDLLAGVGLARRLLDLLAGQGRRTLDDRAGRAVPASR